MQDNELANIYEKALLLSGERKLPHHSKVGVEFIYVVFENTPLEVYCYRLVKKGSEGADLAPVYGDVVSVGGDTTRAFTYHAKSISAPCTERIVSTEVKPILAREYYVNFNKVAHRVRLGYNVVGEVVVPKRHNNVLMFG